MGDRLYFSCKDKTKQDSSPKRKQPNIILITSDQQRYDSVKPRAPSFMRTPHYDVLSREGITFSSAYSDCPICVPARISIMSGKFAVTHGMLGNGSTSEVLNREETLPSLLHNLGYQTAAIGKMHFGPQRVRHGFDEMILPDDYYKQLQRSDSWLQPMHHGLGQNELHPTLSTVPEAMTLTSWTAEKCVEYIQERRDPSIPFFIWCSFTKPHPPLDPPEPYYSMYRGRTDIPGPVHGDWSNIENCPEAFRRWREEWSQDLLDEDLLKEAKAAYLGLVTQVDYNMGRVFAALQDLGMFDDTMFIYTSDHGEYLGDHQSGCKVFFHECSSHVPFVLRLPKSWENRCHGLEVTSPITHADILPTIIKAAGGEIPDFVDGKDLLAVARGEVKPHDYVESSQTIRGLEYYALTDGFWKYIYYPEGANVQLFNIETDPKELKNLAGKEEFSEIEQQLKNELIKRHTQRGWDTVVNGDLVVRPIERESIEDRRNSFWGGFHTEHYSVDVRH